ncbi:MAG TPA: phenylalanine--tRNA ligase subunit beta [Candidatus Bathyarchaeota archaeon]|nr:phenylalanine--tRNA ligase subunit beta [Candidatus Bathyarchaeota archaeon]
MPTITLSLKELVEMTREKDIERLIETITQFKGEVKNIEDDEITIELEPDRPDILSIEGLSRAIRGYLELEVGYPKILRRKIENSNLRVKVANAKTRPYIACALIRNIRLSDEAVKSLMRMQEALHITLGRNRSKVAIGIHNYDAIKPPIIYTEVKSTEKMIPLEMPLEMTLKEVLEKHPKGKQFKHLIKDRCPVYIDEEGIFSFPPIINGERTRVTRETRNLFVELTGTDPEAINQTLNILVCNLLDRGGKLESVKIEYEDRIEETPKLKSKRKIVRVGEVERIIGVKLTVDEMETLLKRMLYGIGRKCEGEIEVIIPPFRVDVMHLVDIIEDVAIAYGYSNLKPELPNIVTAGKPSLVEIIERKIRQALIGLGFQEIITFTLTNRKLQTENMNISGVELVEIENPITEELNAYRRWITPHLIRFLSQNKHVGYPQKIFEIGYTATPTDEKIITQRNTALAIASSKTTFTEIKEIYEALMEELGIEAEIERTEHPSLISGRAAKIMVKGRILGILGEIHPSILNTFEMEVPITIMEITHCQPKYPNEKGSIMTIRSGVEAEWLKGIKENDKK